MGRIAACRASPAATTRGLLPFDAWRGDRAKRPRVAWPATTSDGNGPTQRGRKRGRQHSQGRRADAGRARAPRAVDRGRGGRVQPPLRLDRRRHHGVRSRRLALPPLRRLRDRAGARAAAGPRRHGAGALLPAVSDGQAVPRPHPLVGLSAGGGGGRHHALRAVAGGGLRRPGDRADADRLAGGPRVRRAAARRHAARHRLDHAGRRHRLHPLRHVRQPPAASRGRIAAMRPRTSSPTST